MEPVIRNGVYFVRYIYDKKYQISYAKAGNRLLLAQIDDQGDVIPVYGPGDAGYIVCRYEPIRDYFASGATSECEIIDKLCEYGVFKTKSYTELRLTDWARIELKLRFSLTFK